MSDVMSYARGIGFDDDTKSSFMLEANHVLRKYLQGTINPWTE